jgi:hypothetical protein
MRFAVKQINLVVSATLIILSGAVFTTEANAASRSYNLGYRWASETSQGTLLAYAIDRYAFGPTGKPVLRKVKSWCADMTRYQHYSRENPASRSQWIQGCSDVVMTFRLVDGEPR